MGDKAKFQKKLGKRCPDCGDILELVTRTNIINGVKYSDEYEECDCGYSEKIKNNKKYRGLQEKY